MANAVSIASRLLAALPQSESPEATDGRYGFYCPVEITGDYGHAHIELIIRDFEIDEARRRVAYIEKLADALQGANPRARITVTATQQYLNMRDRISEYPFLLELLTEAITSIGITPVLDPIRGWDGRGASDGNGPADPQYLCRRAEFPRSRRVDSRPVDGARNRDDSHDSALVG